MESRAYSSCCSVKLAHVSDKTQNAARPAGRRAWEFLGVNTLLPLANISGRLLAFCLAEQRDASTPVRVVELHRLKTKEHLGTLRGVLGPQFFKNARADALPTWVGASVS